MTEKQRLKRHEGTPLLVYVSASAAVCGPAEDALKLQFCLDQADCANPFENAAAVVPDTVQDAIGCVFR